MNAWITARKIKPGHEESFQHKWAGDSAPDGMTDAYLLHDEREPHRTLSVSLWDSAERLLKYRTSDDARQRDEALGEMAETEWSRGFAGFRAAELKSGSGLKRWLALFGAVAGLSAAGAAVMLRRRASHGAEHEPYADWQEEARRSEDRGDFPPVAEPRPIVAGNAPHNAGSLSNTPSRPVTASSSPTAAGAPLPVATSTPATQTPGMPRRSSLLVRDLMTRDPATVAHDADLATAAQRMRDLNIGSLPVTADGRLAGMITDRDITLAIGDASRTPNKTRVADVMTEVPVTVSPHISADEAAKLMADHQVRRLPVVEGSRIVGIIALGDLSADGAPDAAGAALEEISEPATPQR